LHILLHFYIIYFTLRLPDAAAWRVRFMQLGAVPTRLIVSTFR